MASSAGSEQKTTAAAEGPALPKLVVFDLDATIWEPEMYELDAPFKKQDGNVYDYRGNHVYTYDDVGEILSDLHTNEKWKSTKIGYASRTYYPEHANDVMVLMEIDDKGTTLGDVVDYTEIFPSDKKQHFRNMQEKSGVDFSDMIFFDNEIRNCRSVERLGVLCVHTPRGLTKSKWEFGLKKFKQLKR